MNYKTMKVEPIRSSEITPEPVYLNRREFMKTIAVAGAGAFLAACGLASKPSPATPPAGLTTSKQGDELGNPLNSYHDITNFNNYYEFSEDKASVANLAKDLKITPWTITVGGLVNKPGTFGLEDLLAKFQQQERIYRLRCVEGWSMVIPWNGFELGELLTLVEPLSSAKYVGFTTLMDTKQMPGESDPLYPWPYTEGLRLDEATNGLSLLATGLYGKPLPAQDGAPLRLVVPWKYGFKSIKAIVRIDLLDKQPPTFWSNIQPNEYGFYANVNPQVDHPRWSQATEQRIGESGRRKTLMFNGYSDQVASLYTGMDLKANY